MFAVLFAWTTATVLESLTPNVLSDRSQAGVAIRSALITVEPQGWAFLTASAQRPELAAWNTKTLDSDMQFPQTKASNLFGLSRNQRAQGPELATLAQSAKRWLTCTSPATPATCLRAAQRAISEDVINRNRHKTLCGHVIIAEVKPTPFEFRSFGYSNSFIVKTATVTISCN